VKIISIFVKHSLLAAM